MPDTLSKMWQDAKENFESMTGKSKPKESKGLSNAFGSHTGLSKPLKNFDEIEDRSQKTNTVSTKDLESGTKMADEMAVYLAEFKKASALYTAVLGKAIENEIDKRNEMNAKTAYEKALKYLKKELVSVEETGEQRISSIRQRFSIAEKNLSVKQKMLINWRNNMKGALARGAAAVAKVKVAPTVENYNSIFPKAARDITMQLIFAKELDGFLADPDILLQAMNPWANQAGKPPASLPKTASELQVKAFLDGFIKELKRAEQLLHTQNAYS